VKGCAAESEQTTTRLKKCAEAVVHYILRAVEIGTLVFVAAFARMRAH